MVKLSDLLPKGGGGNSFYGFAPPGAPIIAIRSSGSWVPDFDGVVRVHVFGGGGGGQFDNTPPRGGGGAGYCAKKISVTAGQTYSVTVGAGGNGGESGIPNGVSGSASSFSGNGHTLTANGGGSGGSGGGGGTASGGDVNYQGSAGDTTFCRGGSVKLTPSGVPRLIGTKFGASEIGNILAAAVVATGALEWAPGIPGLSRSSNDPQEMELSASLLSRGGIWAGGGGYATGPFGGDGGDLGGGGGGTTALTDDSDDGGRGGDGGVLIEVLEVIE